MAFVLVTAEIFWKRLKIAILLSSPSRASCADGQHIEPVQCPVTGRVLMGFRNDVFNLQGIRLLGCLKFAVGTEAGLIGLQRLAEFVVDRTALSSEFVPRCFGIVLLEGSERGWSGSITVVGTPLALTAWPTSKTFIRWLR